MKRNFIIYLLAGIAVLTGIANVLADSNSTRSKARYYYLEGTRREALGYPDEAYAYYQKAYLSDTTYEEAAHTYGYKRLVSSSEKLNTPEEMIKSMQLMQKYIDAYPTDVAAGRFYAFVANQLDTLEETIRVFERMDSLVPKESSILMNLATAYAAKGMFPKAIDAIKRYEAREGYSRPVTITKITYLLVTGDTIAAFDEIDKLIKMNPRDPSYIMLKGNLNEIAGNQDSTFYYYLKAEEMEPDNGSIKMALANYYRQAGDSVAFDNKVYEALLSEDFELEEKLSILSDYLQTLLNDNGNTQRGDYLFDVLRSQYPHEPEVLDLAARYSGAKGDFKKAEENIRYALDQDMQNTTYWSQLIQYQFADSRYNDVLKTYPEAVEHTDVPMGITLMYANAAFLEKEYDKAEKSYIGLIKEVNPQIPVDTVITDNNLRINLDYDNLMRLSTVFNVLGDLYYNLGRKDEAFRAYDNSLFFYQSNPLTLNNYAYFLSETGGDLDKAEQMSFKAIEQDSDNPTYLDTYAWIMFKKKNYEKALEYQQMAIELAEKINDITAEYYHHYGDILFMNHQPAEALENWEKALELEPDNELLKKKVKQKTFFFE